MYFDKILAKEKNKYWIFIALLLGLTILMIYCFMPINKINPGHDILFHYRRFNALMDALKDGSFPIYLDYGAFDNYGYGARWFYPDLILIPFAYIANFTNFVFAYKLMWFVMTLLCGILTYKMANRILENSTAAAFGALLYTFSSYRLSDIYERAALGEALTFTFIPIVFWGLYEIIKGDYKKWYLIAIGYTLFINTHLLSSVLMFLTSLIFIFLNYKAFLKEPKRLYYLVLSGTITLLLCSYFLLPFVEQILSQRFQISDMQYVTHSELTLSETLKSILYPHSVFVSDKFEPYFGLLLIACIILRLFVKDKSRKTKFMDLCTIIGLIYFLLTINIFSWDHYPLKLINFIQFPWRLYEFTTFFLAITSGYYFSKIVTQNKKSIILSSSLILLITVLLITQSSRYKVISRYYTAITDSPVMRMERYYWFFVSLEYLPQNLSVAIIKNKGQNIDAVNKSAIISDTKRKDGYIFCNIKTNTNDILELPLTYYKGYSATLNDKKIETRESKNGLVEVPINSSGKLIVQFTGTSIQKYSIYITIISSLLLIFYILKNRRESNE